MNQLKLFYFDQHSLEAQVKIIKVDGKKIVIDPMPFYPEGGGQPSDAGILRVNGNSFEVIQSVAEGQTISLLLDRELPDGTEPGTHALAIVDGLRRRLFSQLHTALHILNAVVYQKFESLVTGAQISPDTTTRSARMDFRLPHVPGSLLKSLEEPINEIVKEDRPVLCYELPVSEAMNTPGLIRTMNRNAPAHNGMLRVVEVKDLDRQACGGLHVAATGECGKIKIAKVDNKGRDNRRIIIKLDGIGNK